MARSASVHAAEVTISDAAVDELTTYLWLQGVDDPDACVLEWWRERDCKQGLPNLAKLARQYLGTPASSAGIDGIHVYTVYTGCGLRVRAHVYTTCTRVYTMSMCT